MNTAEYLVKKLEELGINDFFGLPGDYNFDILYAIEENPNTNWFGCTNELNAGYAADGYARQRGYGALVTTYGVGELSAMNAIAGSYAENVPVISIVGAPKSKFIEENKLVHHNFNNINTQAYETAFKSVTETTAFLTKENAKMEIDRILKVFVKEKRPVYISIPMDIASFEISERNVDYSWESDRAVLQEVIEKAANKINNSIKPVILGDVLIKRFDAKNEFKEFVEASKLPVTNLIMGTGLINSDYEKYLGMFYSEYRNPQAKKFIDETDCLISVGVINSDVNTFGFGIKQNINSHIAINGTHTYIDNERFDNIKMTDVLEGLSKIIQPRGIKVEPYNNSKEKIQAEKKEISSEYIYPRLQEFFRENDIIITDTGIINFGVLDIKLPNNIDFHNQTLWGSIGWGTPATFGAAVANPTSRIILLTGEGSHQLTAMEIGSMLRAGLKPIIIVLNNKGYTIERILSKNPDDKFNNIVQMNYSKFARVFEGDIWSTRVDNEDDFDKALRVTSIMNKLCYIEVCTSEMDIPELAKEVLGKFKYTKEQKEDKKRTKDEQKSLKKEKTMDFSTKIHESLREE